MHWSTFWNDGWITTFGGSKPKNYDGVVREFWQEKFLELPNGARILDIAAGNGAIATIAAQTSDEHDKDFFVAATDLAEIHAELVGDEDTKQARKQIEFHSFTPCEKQPFDDDSFNLVTSQFGFEYSNIERSLREVRRLLKQGGQFTAISHHVDSELIRAAYRELEIYREALDKLSIFGTVRELFAALGDLGTDEKNVRESLQNAAPFSARVNERMNEFREAYPDDECAKELVAAVSYLARSAVQATKEKRLGAVDAAQVNYRLAQARLVDMVNAALDQERIDSIETTAKKVGFTAVNCLRLFVEDGSLAGWQIHLR